MDARQYCSTANNASPVRGRALRYARAGLVAFSLALALAGCSSDKWGFPYRSSVQQGNWLTQEQVAQLKKGMTRDQVRFVLGSPALTDVLHADRWDYVYYYKPGSGAAEERKFTVWFKNDVLDRWAGDTQPDKQPFQLNKKQAEEAVQRAKDYANELPRPNQPGGTGTVSAPTVK
ncbi:MAG: outer membrane protein assembly factor BamE [Bordetella sp.]|uniref:outer membrane protein assembly factor BamE n=1 Tax=Bordetella sp. TaxID=28081 RepID=UPI003F7B7228